ncbi:hypothetical protein CANARDRAFT_29834 [[Candida] arabinofermentans NRRL YB-2248]|uniref:Sm domain-containing protein n=1 Tax=[Candida] arabinofermentans NRRL YB-2248 TaxID=983967 RepID=A0A1E4SVU3_9ASCO|nr:hypothetical protein CANARDRAFT_29834 [[Candida] arabinofermentans NRRL YB-2248]
MSSFQPINPKPYLLSLIDSKIIIKLKFNNIEYKGTLKSVDNYFNLLLKEDVIEIDKNMESTDGSIVGTPLNGELFIRCNNVLWVSQDLSDDDDDGKVEEGKQVDDDVDATMS